MLNLTFKDALAESQATPKNEERAGHCIHPPPGWCYLKFVQLTSEIMKILGVVFVEYATREEAAANLKSSIPGVSYGAPDIKDELVGKGEVSEGLV